MSETITIHEVEQEISDKINFHKEKLMDVLIDIAKEEAQHSTKNIVPILLGVLSMVVIQTTGRLVDSELHFKKPHKDFIKNFYKSTIDIFEENKRLLNEKSI